MNRKDHREERRRKYRDKDDRNRKQKKLVGRIFGWFIAIVLLLAIGGGTFGYFYVQKNLEPMDASNTTPEMVEIVEGSTAQSIGQLLEENGLVRDGKFFEYYLRFKRVDDIKAATYEFSKAQTLPELVDIIKAGGLSLQEGTITFVVREGERIDEIATSLGENTRFTEKEFLDLMTNQEFAQSMANKFPSILGPTINNDQVRYPLEGYLFPATYDIGPEDTLEQVVEKMITKTESILKQHLAEIADTGHTVNEIMTMASLVEKEGVTSEDRKQIASVFYNRINQDMPLQTDISVLYALQEHKEMVYLKDLEVDSPYNLYKYTGLAPGPFNNPGVDAIIASIDPAQTDYLYFLADMTTGEVYFAKTYDEHLVLKEKYVDNLLPGAESSQ